jgi:hypothetical protein
MESLLRKTHFLVLPFCTIFLLFIACNKLEPDDNPLPHYEDTGPDSVTFSVTVQTLEGIMLPGQYVNLAFSQDSMGKNMMVRRVATDGIGRASFPRLYPRRYFFNCYATYLTNIYYGSALIKLNPQDIRDTVLTVH